VLRSLAWKIRSSEPAGPTPRAARGFRVAPAILVFVLVVHVPRAAEVPAPFRRDVLRAQQIVEALGRELAVPEEIRVVPVAYHPFVLAVRREPEFPERFLLSIEIGFLATLDEAELRAALAHELGHIWIFTHHPYLQTERLANDIGRRVVPRADLERVYVKLWAYEDSPGVDLNKLLGPAG
jgi:hypothetical protein